MLRTIVAETCPPCVDLSMEALRQEALERQKSSDNIFIVIGTLWSQSGKRKVFCMEVRSHDTEEKLLAILRMGLDWIWTRVL